MSRGKDIVNRDRPMPHRKHFDQLKTFENKPTVMSRETGKKQESILQNDRSLNLLAKHQLNTSRRFIATRIFKTLLVISAVPLYTVPTGRQEWVHWF